MVPQHRINTVFSFQSGEYIAKLCQFISTTVYKVACEKSQVGILSVAQVNSFLESFRIAFPTSRVYVRQLQNTVSVEFLRQVGGVECHFPDLEILFTFNSSEKYVSQHCQCRQGRYSSVRDVQTGNSIQSSKQKAEDYKCQFWYAETKSDNKVYAEVVVQTVVHGYENS